MLVTQISARCYFKHLTNTNPILNTLKAKSIYHIRLETRYGKAIAQSLLLGLAPNFEG